MDVSLNDMIGAATAVGGVLAAWLGARWQVRREQLSERLLIVVRVECSHAGAEPPGST
jgi:uncharacterized membrane protein YfcA